MIWLPLLTIDAQATNWTKRFCVEINVDLVDAAVGDRWTTDGQAKPARGFEVAVIDNYFVPPSTIASGHLAQSGTWVGCTPELILTDDPGHDYELKVYPYVEVFGNTIIPGDFSDFDDLSLYTNYVPTSNGTQIAPAIDGAAHPQFNQTAIAAFAIWDHDGHEDATYVIEEGTCCDWYASVGTATIVVDDTVRSKNLMTHLIGHAVAYQVDYDQWGAHGGEPLRTTSAALDSCDGDDSPYSASLLTKEWQSAAAVEGFADFYSEISWNLTTELDCEIAQPYQADWNNNGTYDNGAYDAYNCEGDPNGGVDFVTAKDWLVDLVNGADSGGCTGTSSHRSSQYDWSRFWWDVATDGDFLGTVPEFWQICDIWDAADPYDWDPNQSTPLDTTDDPVPMIGTAFINDGFGDVWYAQDDNGQTH